MTSESMIKPLRRFNIILKKRGIYYEKKLLTVFLMIAMSLNITACVTVSDVDSSTNIQDIESAENSEGNSNDTEKSGSTAPEDNLPEYAKVGQVVSGEKWSIALLYAKEYDSIDSEYYSDKPAEGNKFLALFFDVKNITSENDYFNYLLFEGYADDYSTNVSLIMGNPDGMSAIGGNLDAGKMSKGYIVYEVPSDWKSFEISYKDGVWTTHKAATFVVNKEDVSDADYTYPNSVYPEYALDSSKKTDIGTEISSDKWNVKLIDVKKYETVGDIFTQSADDGKEFVIFYLEAENVSSADDYFNTLYFRSYVDGYITEQTLLLSDIDGYSSMSGDVAAGKKIKGYVAVQAPLGWKSIELIYDDGAFIENKVAEFGIINE